MSEVRAAMHAVTVWQPWATLIAYQWKPWEFRGRPAPKYVVGRRIAIHAGARPVSVLEVRALLVKLHSPSWRETGLARGPTIELLEVVKLDPTMLPRSSVVCTALLGKPVRGVELAAQLGIVNDSDRAEHGNWGWPLTQIELQQPPSPASGRQGWWLWTPP